MNSNRIWCPLQISGRLGDGTYFFLRHRRDNLQIGFGASHDAAITQAFGYGGYDIDGLDEPNQNAVVESYQSHFNRAWQSYSAAKD